jgi:hypothetical protein
VERGKNEAWSCIRSNGLVRGAVERSYPLDPSIARESGIRNSLGLGLASRAPFLSFAAVPKRGVFPVFRVAQSWRSKSSELERNEIAAHEARANVASRSACVVPPPLAVPPHDLTDRDLSTLFTIDLNCLSSHQQTIVAQFGQNQTDPKATLRFFFPRKKRWPP